SLSTESSSALSILHTPRQKPRPSAQQQPKSSSNRLAVRVFPLDCLGLPGKTPAAASSASSKHRLKVTASPRRSGKPQSARHRFPHSSGTSETSARKSKRANRHPQTRQRKRATRRL